MSDKKDKDEEKHKDKRTITREHRQGRLRSRPAVASGPAKPGLEPLNLGKPRDALLYVPPSYDPGTPAPLFVWLHGAGGDERRGLSRMQVHADAAGVVLLSPASRATSTWDFLVSDLGPDVAFIDSALDVAFSKCNIDRARTAIGGFSDGASYGLTLGLANGDLFTHILAFSPGFAAPKVIAGKPRVFISHGTDDDVLPIDRCSRQLVPKLKNAGYEVDYREFDGRHVLPPDIAQEAIRQLAAGTDRSQTR